MTLRLAVIGAGVMGAKVAATAAAIDGLEVTAVVDPDAARAESAAGAVGAVAVPTLAAVIEGRLADAIYVGLPHHLHEQACVDGARAGLHLLVDKPLCNTLDEAARIADATEAAGVQLMLGFSYRFRAEWRRAQEWIAAGRIGDAVLVSDNIIEAQFATPAWYWSRAAGGGVLQLQSHHAFDRTAWLLGEAIARVSCRTTVLPGDEVESAAIIGAESETGVLVDVAIGFARQYGSHANAITVIQGTHGLITIDSMARTATLSTADDGSESIAGASDDWLATELADFRDACASPGDTVPGLAEGIAALACAAASVDSAAASGQWIDVGDRLR
ncbi:MAG: oxidoreductase domain protein [Rhodoglobus sp.]|nr:oxidoreductase domain protein [Rhodoglobus sp.]